MKVAPIIPELKWLAQVYGARSRRRPVLEELHHGGQLPHGPHQHPREQVPPHLRDPGGLRALGVPLRGLDQPAGQESNTCDVAPAAASGVIGDACAADTDCSAGDFCSADYPRPVPEELLGQHHLPSRQRLHRAEQALQDLHHRRRLHAHRLSLRDRDRPRRGEREDLRPLAGRRRLASLPSLGGEAGAVEPAARRTSGDLL